MHTAERYLQFMYVSICLHEYVCHVYLGPLEVGGFGCPYNRSYRWLWASIWVLGMEAPSSARATSARAAKPSLQPSVWIFMHVLIHCEL